MPSSSIRPSSSASRVRVAYLVSHPIQYQAPLLRRIAQEPDIELTVLYGSDFSVRSYHDEGFGVQVQWDVPLLEGYPYKFLRRLRDDGTNGVFSPMNRGLLQEFTGADGEPRFDLLWIHGYASVNALHAMLVARALDVPVVLRSDSWLRDRPRSSATLWLKRIFFAGLRELVDGALSSGTHNTAYWRFYLGDGFPLFLLPYAVDNDFFRQRSLAAASRREELRAELGLTAGRPVILFASKLQARKHCGDLIAAWAMMSEDGREPVPYLLIVGDGEERATLEQQAAATGFEGIRFCGFRNQSELPRFLDLCHVFVLPSRHEPWGLIVNEAMNAARAIIVSDDVGCQVDLVRDGVEGCVYPVRDVIALKEALERVLATPETARAMGQRAFETVSRWSFEEDVRGLREALAHLTRKIIA